MVKASASSDAGSSHCTSSIASRTGASCCEALDGRQQRRSDRMRCDRRAVAVVQEQGTGQRAALYAGQVGQDGRDVRAQQVGDGRERERGLRLRRRAREHAHVPLPRVLDTGTP